MDYGKVIKHLRRAKTDFTSAKFASKINVTAATLSRIENNKSVPSEETIRSICDYFKIPTGYIHWKAQESIDIPKRCEEMVWHINKDVERFV